MESIVQILFGILFAGTHEEQRYIIDHIKTIYFEERAYGEIFTAAANLNLAGKAVNIVSVKEALLTGANSVELKKRMKVFKDFFVGTGELQTVSSDDDVRHHLAILLASLSMNRTYSTPVDVATQIFLGNYVAKEKKNLILEYQQKLRDYPGMAYTDELTQKLKTLEALLVDNTWKNYIIDFDALEKEPDDVALIQRKGQGYFFRGNIYLITGYAGSMKSFICLTIAAAAGNKGAAADRTLSFYSTTEGLNILYIDTELARNTIRKRWRSLKKMLGGKFDQSRFSYLSLRLVQGNLEAKMHIFDTACHQLKPDIVVIDSGRDLCLNFNDNLEADNLVAHFKQIATDLNAVLICTSHKSLGNGNAKGHFGMRMNEAAGLEMSLTKVTDGKETYVRVEFPKQREDQYEPFAFKYDAEFGWLVEHAPTVDHQEENRQYKAAKAAVERILRPGQMIKHNDLMRRITAEIVGNNGKNVSERTAKNYINVLSGTVLTCDADGWYSLVDPDAEIPFDEDLPG